MWKNFPTHLYYLLHHICNLNAGDFMEKNRNSAALRDSFFLTCPVALSRMFSQFLAIRNQVFSCEYPRPKTNIFLLTRLRLSQDAEDCFRLINP